MKPLEITVIPVYYHVSSKKTLENNSNNSNCVVFKPGASLSESWRDWERERERENVTLIVASSRRKLLIQLCSASVGQCGPQHYWFGSKHDAFRSFYIPGWEPYMPSCLVHTVV